MQTISTKLNKQTAKKFLEVYNDEGKCQSEMLRDVIGNLCEYYSDEQHENMEIIVEDVKPTIEIIPKLKNARIIY